MWIDRIIELVPGRRLVAIKNVSLSEDHLHDHFAATDGQAALPIMPASLIIEGMAQAAGTLVGHAEAFREKVVLAKVTLAELDRDAVPGDTLRYTAEIRQMDRQGAATVGTVELRDHASGAAWVQIGRIELMFSHVDQQMGLKAGGAAGPAFPEHNFVFGEGFQTLLRTSGISIPE
jgi:3-hydroxyacyl-[acyl-carrier-protein] dehydratase